MVALALPARAYADRVPRVRAERPFYWHAAKRSAGDDIYHDNHQTLYCGCDHVAATSGTGGSITLSDCGMERLDRYVTRASKMEWEHIVPASLMPARHMSCWTNPGQFDRCLKDDGTSIGGRACCEKVSRRAREMIFDLHNLAPAIGQLNAYRLNDRYGVVDDSGPVERWPGCDARHFRANRAREHRFEPPDCVKGDVARVWFYMHDEYGVVIPDGEWNMFVDWSDNNPVSAWELERDTRIEAAQGDGNPYVTGHNADPGGACEWDSE